MRVSVRARRIIRWAAISTCAAVALAFAALEALILAFPFPEECLAEVSGGGSCLILDREGGLVAWRVGPRDEWRLPVSVDEVSPWLVKAIVAAEDERFWSHDGVDEVAVARALIQNVSSGRRVSGASTISMQVVRMLEPSERTYAAKLRESFRALQLERLARNRSDPFGDLASVQLRPAEGRAGRGEGPSTVLPERMAGKARVLTCYLNIAPFGGNVTGAEAAARRYFAKPAAELSLGEAALLAGIPQSPARLNPARHLGRALARREYVFKRMIELGLVSADEVASARREAIVIAAPAPGTGAPRFADYVTSVRGASGGIVRTTLDPRAQAAAREAVAERARNASPGLGAALVVIGVEEVELLAMVGSSDPGNPLVGWVNGATARRQPGSLLKPLIYAAAYDIGILTPAGVVHDVPTSWKGYRPRNIDRDFLGPIPAERALAESRNVPAVRLLDSVGVPRLVEDMAALGLGVDAAEAKAGLSLALGTTEVRLLDVAVAYAALARGGEHAQPRVFMGDPADQSDPAERPAHRVWSEGASYLTLRSLGAADSRERARPAWKTGTSWDHRDAWAVVATPRYVVAAWCGRVSGGGDDELLGARSALPLAAAVLERLDPDCRSYWPRPETVSVRSVCVRSGAPPSPLCPDRADAEFIRGVSPEAPCTVHRRGVGGSGGVAEGQARSTVRPALTGVAEVWPADVAAFLDARSRWLEPGAPASAGARASDAFNVSRAVGITIVAPVDGAEYVAAGGPRVRLPLTATSSADRLYWFLDGELVSESTPGAVVYRSVGPGRHVVSAATDDGGVARAEFAVVRMTGAR